MNDPHRIKLQIFHMILIDSRIQKPKLHYEKQIKKLVETIYADNKHYIIVTI